MVETIASISPRDFQRLRDAGEEPRLVDVRTPAEFRSGHIPGARSMPLDALVPERLSAAPGSGTDRTLYLTCHSGQRALQAAERLRTAGVRRVALIEGGTEAWRQAGLPLVHPARPPALSLEQQVNITLGSLIMLKVVFGFTLHELFFVAAALIGAGLVITGVTRWCGMARLLARMPWNRTSAATAPGPESPGRARSTLSSEVSA